MVTAGGYHEGTHGFLRPCKYIAPTILGVCIFLAAVNTVAALPNVYCSGVCDLAWSPVDAGLLAAVNTAGLWLYQIDDGLTKPTLFPHPYSTSLSFDPQGQYVAVTTCPSISVPTRKCNGSISIFDIEEQAWQHLVTYHYGIDNVKFSPDGRYVAFEKDELRNDGLQFIDLTTHETFSITEFYMTSRVLDYAFDSQSTRVAISNGYIDPSHQFNGVSLWRLSDQELLTSTKNGILAPSLMFTPSDNELIMVGYDSKLLSWNFEVGSLSSRGQMLDILRDNINAYAFYPPSYLAASILDDWLPVSDRRLFVWEVDSGEQIFYEDVPPDRFSDLIAVNNGGEHIAFTSTVDARMLVEIWDQSTDSNVVIRLTQ